MIDNARSRQVARGRVKASSRARIRIRARAKARPRARPRIKPKTRFIVVSFLLNTVDRYYVEAGAPKEM